MGQQFSKEELHALRNRISIRDLIEHSLEIPCKEVEGVFRFLCPNCGEFQTAVNPKTNLSRCFRCQENFNTIEIVMKDRQLSFVDSVKLLRQLFGESASPHVPLPVGMLHQATSTSGIS